MIEVKTLKKYYRIRHNPLARFRHPDHIVKAVDNVSFEVKPGEVMGLVGESGCGKTTLARTMLRLDMPTSGRVLYAGHDIFGMSKTELKVLRKQVQIIFQDSNSTLDPRMSLGRILEEPLLIHKIGDKKSRRVYIDEIMEKVKLSSSFLSRYPSELSGGQRQRLSIARALLLEPQCIIADEPLSGLDPVVSAQLLDLMLSLQKEGNLTYLLISHNLNTVTYASDRIAVMYRGRIVEIIDGGRFENEAAHPYTRFLIKPSPSLAEDGVDEDIHSYLHHHEHTGCMFADKCPYKTKICSESAPELREIAEGHFVACYQAD